MITIYYLYLYIYKLFNYIVIIFLFNFKVHFYLLQELTRDLRIYPNISWHNLVFKTSYSDFPKAIMHRNAKQRKAAENLVHLKNIQIHFNSAREQGDLDWLTYVISKLNWITGTVRDNHDRRCNIKATVCGWIIQRPHYWPTVISGRHSYFRLRVLILSTEWGRLVYMELRNTDNVYIN